MIYGLCDEASVPEILGVDERVLEMVIAQTKTMKNLARPGPSKRLR